jgi:F-type H+-transporting ATPase subunit b
VEQLDASHPQADDAEHGDASHGEGAHGNTNPLSVDPDLTLFTLIIFLLTMAVLAKFAWGPIQEALERREQSIADQIAEAQKSRDEARRLLEQHETRLASARDEINALMDGARREAESQKQSILAEAGKLASDQQARAVREINSAKNAALEELARSSVDQAVGLAGRIIGQTLRAEDHANLITEALHKMPSKN